MALSLKHLFESPKAATANSSDVDGPIWNQEHVITLTAGNLLGAHTSGDGSADEVTLGSGLSMSTSGVLTVTGGAGDLIAANNLSDVASAATSRTNLGVDAAGTDNSTDVTLAGTGTYLSLAGQAITVDPITVSDISDIAASYQPLATVLTNTTASFVIADKTKLDFLSVTQAVNLDTMESDIATNTAKTSNVTHTGDVTGSGALTIAAKAVDVAMLADGTDGELITWSAAGVAETIAVGTATHVLTSNGVGVAPTFQVASGGGGAPEGTAVLSTGEAGGTKFLREDGDGTSSWQVPAGSGDVAKVGTPANDQVGVWTGDGTLEGGTTFTFNGSDLKLTEPVNDGNPTWQIGSSDTEASHLVVNYDTGAQTLDYVEWHTDTASATANKGHFRFSPDGTEVLRVQDANIDVTGTITVSSTVDGRDLATDGTKLDGIETAADVTDVTNVTAAGALMDSELTAIASIKALDQGVAVADSPQFTAVNVGHATDTTLARSSAGNLSIEGNLIYRAGGTDVPVADGGTGSTTASGARTNLGLAIGTDVQAFDADIPTAAASQIQMETGTEAGLLSMSPLRVAQAIAALAAGGGGGGINAISIQKFTATGAGTWTKPTGLVVAIALCTGGGGGGFSEGSGDSASGAGAGGTALKVYAAADLSATQATSVGAGGAANGNAGANTTFAALTGAAGAGANNSSSGSSVAGGEGGVPTGGDLNIKGGKGTGGGNATAGSSGGSSFWGGSGAFGAGGHGASSGAGGATDGSDGVIIVIEFKTV